LSLIGTSTRCNNFYSTHSQVALKKVRNYFLPWEKEKKKKKEKKKITWFSNLSFAERNVGQALQGLNQQVT